MMPDRRPVLVVAIAALLAASLPAPAGIADPATASADPGDRLGMHWRVPPGGRTVLVVDRTAPAWDGALRAAVASWGAADPALDFVVTEAAPDDGGCPETRGAITVCSAVYGSGNRGWAYPTPAKDGVHIASALVFFDDAHYPADAYPWPATPEREALAAHEYGHALGLDHGDVPYDGCLAEVRDPAETQPGVQDIARLTVFAGHTHRPGDGPHRHGTGNQGRR